MKKEDLRAVTFGPGNNKKGFFHQWVVANDTVYAIIEDLEGNVDKLPYHLIKFAN